MAIKRPNSRLSREVAPSQAHLYEKLGFAGSAASSCLSGVFYEFPAYFMCINKLDFYFIIIDDFISCFNSNSTVFVICTINDAAMLIEWIRPASP